MRQAIDFYHFHLFFALLGLIIFQRNTAEAARSSGGCSKAVGHFFEYKTPKIVHTGSKKVGLIFRLIQLFVIAYIAVSVIF